MQDNYSIKAHENILMCFKVFFIPINLVITYKNKFKLHMCNKTI